jgi:NAD(P)-dependent dehydrogenase (short-subunit alcohol dehydrogenase family)
MILAMMILFVILAIVILFRWKSTTYRNSDDLVTSVSTKRSENYSYRSELVEQIYEFAKDNGNNSCSRQLQKTCHALDLFDRQEPLNTLRFVCPLQKTLSCYGCKKQCRKTHAVYVYSCQECGERNQNYRHLTRDLSGCTALVTGARTKLGHQIVLKLLRAGCTVIGTTRLVSEAVEQMRSYEDSADWFERFHPVLLDLDTPALDVALQPLCQLLESKPFCGRLDVLINCAAQTIQSRESKIQGNFTPPVEKNRYGDAKFADPNRSNSWNQTVLDTYQQEIEQVYRINSVAPFILVQKMIPFLRESSLTPYIINVHAREGLFCCRHKSPKHPHTNMAKAALAMLTRCLIDQKLSTKTGQRFSIHGCDPGWISVDEYYQDQRPWIVPPLDEIDGAARILFPLFKQLKSLRKTRKHFDWFLY